MPESFLGDGLIFEELLPLHWLPGPLPQGLALARLNADNQQLLGAESSLDEVRVSEALKDESPALVHELQRLEYKLNILLRLTAEIAAAQRRLAARAARRVSGRAGLEWFGAAAPAVGEHGPRAYLHQSRAAAAAQDSQQRRGRTRCRTAERVAQLEFRDLSEARGGHPREAHFPPPSRLVAGARASSPSAPSESKPLLPESLIAKFERSPYMRCGCLPTAFLSSSSVSMWPDLRLSEQSQ